MGSICRLFPPRICFFEVTKNYINHISHSSEIFFIPFFRYEGYVNDLVLARFENDKSYSSIVFSRDKERHAGRYILGYFVVHNIVPGNLIPFILLFFSVCRSREAG